MLRVERSSRATWDLLSSNHAQGVSSWSERQLRRDRYVYTRIFPPCREKSFCYSRALMLCRSIICLLVVLFGASGIGGGVGVAAEMVFDFKDDKVNESPRKFRSAITGEGAPGD